MRVDIGSQGCSQHSAAPTSDGASQEFWSELDRKGRLATYNFDEGEVCYDDVLYNLHSFADKRGPWHFMTRDFTDPDEAAIGIAKEVSDIVYTSLSEVADSKLGLAGRTLPPQGSKNHCRHLMMLTMLFSVMSNEPSTNLSYLEIGGGHGNMARIVGSARLTRPFQRWTIFDMRHSLMVQDWFLRNSLRDVDVRNTLNLGDDMLSIEGFFAATRPEANSELLLVEKTYVHSFALHFSGCDVLIATHSWSELPWEDFLAYYNLFITGKSVGTFCMQLRKVGPRMIFLSGR